MVKDKKTLTISSNLKKKIDTTNIQSSGKKSFSVEKKNHLKIINLLISLAPHLIMILILILKEKILKENLLNNKLPKILSKKIINLLEKVSLN